MSRLLTGLVNKGLIKRPRASGDSRVRQLYLTDEGAEAYYFIESCALEIFSQKLESFSDCELEDFVRIFELFIREPYDWVRLIEPKSFIKVLNTDIERAQAKGIVMRSAVESELENKVPEKLYEDNQVLIGIFANKELSGAMVVNPNDKIAQVPVWFCKKPISDIAKAIWIDEIPTLLSNHFRGDYSSIRIDTSRTLSNVI
jgi:hypothetical protein